MDKVDFNDDWKFAFEKLSRQMTDQVRGVWLLIKIGVIIIISNSINTTIIVSMSYIASNYCKNISYYISSCNSIRVIINISIIITKIIISTNVILSNNNSNINSIGISLVIFMYL